MYIYIIKKIGKYPKEGQLEYSDRNKINGERFDFESNRKKILFRIGKRFYFESEKDFISNLI